MDPTPYETVNKILEGHRLGHYDLLRSVSLLETYTLQRPEQTQQEIFQALWSALVTEPLKECPRYSQYTPSVHAVVIRSIATFGPTADLPSRVFGLLRWGDAPAAQELWARSICNQLSYSMFHNAERFNQATLDQTKALCSTYTFVRAAELTDVQFPKLVADAAADLEKTVQRIEYNRFATSLETVQRTDYVRLAASLKNPQTTAELQSPELDRYLATLGFPNEVAAAMSRAQNYLAGDDLFEPKQAADLIRTSIDEIHRAVVVELEGMTGVKYQGQQKDGARRAYMREQGFISQPEEEFFSNIYALVSKEGSHKLIAEKETVLLLETTVRGYLLLLLRRMIARKSPPPSRTIP